MTKEEILQGESKNIEFKVSLPSRSEKYMKTVIAFANSQGGKIIIGIDDKTHEVVGVDSEILFRTMDSISNAIDDMCEPQIIPNIEPQTIDGKTVIVITVEAGKNRPYYLKAQGRDNGTYIRTAGTSRPAHHYKIVELEMEGRRISWDELTCIGYKVTDKAVKKLCRDIEKYRTEMGLPKRKVTKSQLINWKILREEEGDIIANNAFVLLTSDYFQFSKIQCAVFKGVDRGVFVDKREYTGPLYEQIDEAVDFVLRNIHLGVRIERIVRQEIYELPVNAIREMIVNAVCHRNFNEESCVQVAIYDDRLEVTSPGGLYYGLTLEQAMNGHSQLRNRAIANVFAQMGIVESWGTGIKKIISEAAASGIREPEFLLIDDMFRINLYRNTDVSTSEASENIGEASENIGEASENIGETSGNIGETAKKQNENYEINETQTLILKMIAKDNRISAKNISNAVGISSRNVENNIRKLREQGILQRVGSPKTGYWQIKK